MKRKTKVPKRWRRKEEEEIRSVSPEEAERLRERRRMELQLARKIQRRLRTDEMKVERMPLIRMLIRVARSVFPRATNDIDRQVSTNLG